MIELKNERAIQGRGENEKTKRKEDGMTIPEINLVLDDSTIIGTIAFKPYSFFGG